MVDGTGLENRHTRKGIEGSNPSLSAIYFYYLTLTKAPTSHSYPLRKQGVRALGILPDGASPMQTISPDIPDTNRHRIGTIPASDRSFAKTISCAVPSACVRDAPILS